MARGPHSTSANWCMENRYIYIYARCLLHSICLPKEQSPVRESLELLWIVLTDERAVSSGWLKVHHISYPQCRSCVSSQKCRQQRLLLVCLSLLWISTLPLHSSQRPSTKAYLILFCLKDGNVCSFYPRTPKTHNRQFLILLNIRPAQGGTKPLEGSQKEKQLLHR